MITIEKHINGPWYVDNGSMYNRCNSSVMLDEDIAILVDSDVENDVGCLLKIGKYDTVSEYYNRYVESFKNGKSPRQIDTLMVIRFNVKFEAIPEHGVSEFAPDGYNFTVDEICTILNWFNNCIGKKMGEFLTMSLDDAKAKIESLQKAGF